MRFRGKSHRHAIALIIFGQGHEVHLGCATIIETVKTILQKSLRKLPRAIGTEVEEYHHVAIVDPTLVRSLENHRHQELIGFIVFVLFGDRFASEHAFLLALTVNDGIPSQLGPLPSACLGPSHNNVPPQSRCGLRFGPTSLPPH